jgi:hypothetical protein
MAVYKETNNPNEIRFNCPYCGDVKFHLYINVQKLVGFCQRCKRIYTRAEVLRFLGDMEVEHIEGSTQTKEYPPLVYTSTSLIPLDDVRELLRLFKKEHLAEKVVEWGWGVSYRGLVIPIGDNGYQIRTWAGKPKYLVYPPGFKLSHYLYGLSKLNINEIVHLVESPFDVLAVRNSVASFGAHISKEQVGLLLDKRVRVVNLFWDADVDKITKIEVGKTLSQYFEVYVTDLSIASPSMIDKFKPEIKTFKLEEYTLN